MDRCLLGLKGKDIKAFSNENTSWWFSNTLLAIPPTENYHNSKMEEETNDMEEEAKAIDAAGERDLTKLPGLNEKYVFILGIFQNLHNLDMEKEAKTEVPILFSVWWTNWLLANTIMLLFDYIT